MDRDYSSLAAAFSTVLPLDGPATPPRVNPVSDEAVETLGNVDTPEPADADDEAITGAGGAYM